MRDQALQHSLKKNFEPGLAPPKKVPDQAFWLNQRKPMDKFDRMDENNRKDDIKDLRDLLELEQQVEDHIQMKSMEYHTYMSYRQNKKSNEKTTLRVKLAEYYHEMVDSSK